MVVLELEAARPLRTALVWQQDIQARRDVFLILFIRDS